MRLTRTAAIAGAATAAAALVLAGCGGSSGGTPAASGSSGPSSGCGGKLQASGSTFQQPMEAAWINGFHAQCPGAQINYNPVGSGQGIADFGAGTDVFAGSDVTMVAAEQSAADSRCGGSKAIHLPITAGGVGITYNLSGVHALKLDGTTITKIFTGKITKWNDSAIAALNPGVTLPSAPIRVFVRQDPSGTTSVFATYMHAVDPTGWTGDTSKNATFPVGTGATGSAGVAAKVQQTADSITYVEQSYAAEKNLPTVQVKNGAGKYVALTVPGVSAALASATSASAGGQDLSQQINYNPSNPKAYPISTVSYVIVCSKYPSKDAGLASTLKQYLTYAVTTGQSQASSLGFAPLPTALGAKVKAAVVTIS